MDEARIIGESQNFTRDLVNEPSNRMTPTILADRAKKMAAEVGSEMRSLRRGQDQGTEDGSFLERGPGLGRTARADRPALRTRGRARETGAGTGRQGHHLRHRRHFHQARRRHGKNEIRHGRRRHHDRRHARHRAAQAEGENHGHHSAPRKTCRRARRRNRATCRSPCPANRSRSSTPTPKAAWCWPTVSTTRANSAALT